MVESMTVQPIHGVPDDEDDLSAAPVRQGIQSVEIAARVLRAIESGLGPMTLGQVAAGSGMQPSKAHRYLVSLGRAGLVSRSTTSGRYDLGPATRRLGIAALRRTDEVAVATEHVQVLRDRTSHAVNLAVWGEHGPVLIRWDYGSWPLPITVRVGATMPLLTSSVGQAYLAHLPEALAVPLLTGPHDDGQQGQVDRSTDAVVAQVSAIRARVLREGYALTNDAVVPGITSVAAAVPGAPDSLPVVVALVLPSRQATDEVVAVMAKELLATVAAIADELGHARQESSRRA